ncbi:MAG: hypothetical protein HYV38_01925 [Candidatus Levybacteria bacterium]|nr:hypothetical protein [Candidatus Levybacteria bacterium]MBI2420818.1 hypothetical protein [Candidatus Levybacteria bacterium]
MDNISRLRELFEKDGNIVIFVSENHGIDEMAGALSLYLSLNSANKNVSIVSPKQPLVEVSNLVGIDKVKTDASGTGGDLIVSFPYQEGEIEKISYTLDNGALNIVVKPSGESLSFSEKDVLYKHTGSTPSALVAFGVKRLSEVNKIFDVPSLKDTILVNIDKGSDNEGFGDIVFVSQNASSISEQVANILLSLGYQLDLDLSQNLLSGIISSTSNFQNPRTSSLAFEMSGILMRNGARRRSVAEPVSTQAPVGPQSLPLQPQQSIRSQQPRFQPQQRRPQQPFSGQRDFKKEERKDKNPPEDWLSPKIFKGSTNIS